MSMLFTVGSEAYLHLLTFGVISGNIWVNKVRSLCCKVLIIQWAVPLCFIDLNISITHLVLRSTVYLIFNLWLKKKNVGMGKKLLISEWGPRDKTTPTAGSLEIELLPSMYYGNRTL